MEQTAESTSRPTPLPYERQPGESSRAFRAFAIYRDLGPSRSLNAAYRHAKGSQDPALRAHAVWSGWSSKFDWPVRAAAYDDHVDAQIRHEREARFRELEARRMDCEIAEQAEVEQLAALVTEKIREYAKLPPTDVTQRTVTKDAKGNETVITNKVRGADPGKLARLLKERMAAKRRAMLGPRMEGLRLSARIEEARGLIFPASEQPALSDPGEADETLNALDVLIGRITGIAERRRARERAVEAVEPGSLPAQL